jgi:hypothetical protein
VSIYETREAIVKELQNYLAQRLLVVEDYDAVKEVSRDAAAMLITAGPHNRVTQDPLRRGGVACLRRHAQGHERLKAHQ